MSAILDPRAETAPVSFQAQPQPQPLAVPHVLKGRLKTGQDVLHRSRDLGQGFMTPALDLDEAVWLRNEPGPAFDTPMAEIIDFLVELGTRLNLKNPLMREALEGMVQVSTLDRRILGNCYEDMGHMFTREVLEAEITQSVGSVAVIDGWQSTSHAGVSARLRAFPGRIVHVMAGNSPMVAGLSVMRGALSKSVNLLKMASNDLFTPTAILRTMAGIEATHPVTRSFSAVYWKGGDASIESVLFRPQYFDKLVAWGGESAIRHALKYVGPGFELIAFDPKVSVSMIGREAFDAADSGATLAELAQRGAADVLSFDQDACNASRYQFVEGTTEQVDRYAQQLARALGQDVRYGAGQGAPTPPDIREAVDALRHLEPIYAVFGGYDGGGLVVRSDEPVDFHPTCKTVNVVQVESLAAALKHITVATQTVGVWPPARKRALRDGLACAGVQRIVTLGEVNVHGAVGGKPHDAGFPIHRFMRWISEEGAQA
jgi:hypothetical protein